MRATTSIPPIIATLVLAGCGGGGSLEPPEPAQVFTPEDRLYYDNTGGVQDSLRLVIRDAEEFETLWDRATSTQVSPPAPPPLDFDQRMIVVVAAGRMNSDDEIRVDSAVVRERTTVDGREEDVLRIMVRTTKACSGFDAPGYPLEIVRLPRFDGPVEFDETTVSGPGCGQQSPAHEPFGSGEP